MVDTTKTQSDSELLEAMLRDAERADEPGQFVRELVIQRGDESKDEPPMVAMPVKSAGYTVVYDTKTGIPSIINNNNLRYQLKKKRGDGSFVYELKQRVIPEVGKHLCSLHKNAPNREHYDALGFATCTKEGLASLYQVRRHMARTHKDEWKAIEDERLEKERQEDREFQRALMGKATDKVKGTPEAPLYISNKDKKK